jgi:PAS domain S-box-containing protein
LSALIVVGIGAALALLLAGLAFPQQRAALASGAALLAIAAALVAILLAHRQGRAQRARAEDLTEAAMDPIVMVDKDQRILRFNAAAERAFGWPRDKVLGQHLDMLIPERFCPGHRTHVREFAKTGTTSRRMGGHAVLAALRADGTEFPIEASISQHLEDGEQRLTVILRDVTERMQAQALLAASETRMRGILDSAMDGIITVDDSQRIVIFNAAAEAMFGCRRDEAIGAPLDSFLPFRYRGGHAEYVKRFGEGDTSPRRMAAARVVLGLRRNGEEFPIDASISHEKIGDARFYTVILRDVSARETALAELRRSKQELQELGAAAEATREQEKSRVARELHDELGQALTMLRMDVAWCKANVPEDVVDGVATKLERMEALLKSTVAATRRIASDLRPLILDDLGLAPALEWLVQNMSQRSGIPCEFSIDDPNLSLPPAQSTAVFRIVQEALTNIAKHARATRAEVAVRQDHGVVRILVSDNGVGFVPENPRKPESFGLVGLRERISLLRGTADIRSEPGAGTTVEVALPMPVPETST